jgi:Leucine-rich repeat (LRR) protein
MNKILIYILCLISLSTYINAQTTAIPDAIFEQRLITLGIDSDGLVNGQILNSDAIGVTSLYFPTFGISDLTGISAFVDLDTLTCGGNNLTNLDVSNNIALTYLECWGNSFTSLDVSNNINLRMLLCSSNNLSSLDVSNCPALVSLDCGYNQLTSLNLANNNALIWLECHQNNLSSLDVSNNASLEYLDCKNNNLSTVNVTNNPLITTLSCSNNNLSSLDVSSCSALVGFACYNNSLSSLDLTSNLNLLEVVLDDNNLISLDVSNNINLENLYLSRNNLTSLDVSNNVNLVDLGCGGNNLTTLDLMSNDSLTVAYCRGNRLNLRICLKTFQIINNSIVVVKDPTADISENCSPLSVEGRVVIDDNLNCLVDTSEQGLRGQWIRFVRTTDADIKYAFVDDTLGNYKAYLDTGTYVVTVIPNGTYWESCPDSQIVVIDTNYIVQTLDWTLQPLVSCPNLQVDVAAPFLRMTGGGSAYTVSYCNVGSIPAQAAYVEVDIDADLNVLSSTLPIASQVGTVYTFNLGTVGIGACGSFQIQVSVDTSAQFQQTHCTEAHIYPDSICNPVWTGPRVDGFVNCQSTQVNFIVENRGAAMLVPQPYTIFEDNIAMRIGTVNLGAGQSTTLMEPAVAGKTYRIEVDQAPGFPGILGNLVFSRTIEGCNPLLGGGFNTGFVTQFSNGHSAPFMAIDCQQNIASYDPNDKAAQPVGYGIQHYIEQNIGIDYKIRFQNTGTDTAFNIVILDTLSTYLDATSLQMGASSDSYTWTIGAGNVLKVVFSNIMLVDSNANEPLSHGFFRYSIQQKNNNLIGTVIENQAAIYFDYNPAIFTNTTFHTVGDNFVPVILSVEEVYVDEIAVRAFPNPFNFTTTIKVEGKSYESLELMVFDVSGRVVAQKQTSQGNQIQFSKGNLEEGIYIYQLKGDGVLLNTGKIAVQ